LKYLGILYSLKCNLQKIKKLFSRDLMNLLFNYNSFIQRTPEKGKLENSSTGNNIVLVNCNLDEAEA
jgi:hypothetical protein